MIQEKKERIFISYKRVDKERVFAIKDGIKKATGEDCWIDLDGIESNAQFVAKIVSAIDECDVFLFMRSKEHNNITNLETDWTIREVNYALEEHKNIVIVNLDKTPMPKWFKFMFPNKQEIDATDPEKIDRLYKDLCGWLGIAYNEFSNQLKVETDEPVSLGSVHELVALGAKLGSDGVPEKLQEQFVNDLVKTKRLATAQNNLGFHLSDTEKRIKYLEEAAQNGSGAALINLAHIYEYGEGVERDIDKAIDCYRSAIVHHGHTEFVDDIRALIKEKESKAKEAKSQPIHPIQAISVNGVSFNMIKVQGGTFTIGATPEQESENPWDDERPAHEVAVTDYMIGETPVTQALWETVMGVSIQEQCKKGTLGSSLRGVGANYPMYHISWDDCQEFVARLSQQTGKKFRLPTEAEWEFAARGGNQGKGFKYAGSDTLGDVAWYDDGQTFETSPVAQKQPNELGLYDMSGNVWEWCQDWYINYGVELTPAMLKSAGMSHVTRGGSWNRAPRFCRVSVRGHSTPNERVNYVGLRLVMEIE